jgi:uncharacterized OsmC-like protein
MKMSARVTNGLHRHEAIVETNEAGKTVAIAPKATGYGSSVNGGELLLLALATCFCNDIYREAQLRNIDVSNVEVICTGEFGAAGEPGFNFSYKATVQANAPQEVIDELIRHTDQVAEIHNTLRKGLPITLIK